MVCPTPFPYVTWRTPHSPSCQGLQQLLLREARNILRYRGAELGLADRPGAEPDRRGDGVGVRAWQPRRQHGHTDALWWAVTTITTVGCGDRFPMSSAGRAVAVVLMIAGIAMFGVITATIAAYFVEQKAEEDVAGRLDQIMERLGRSEARHPNT